MTLPDPPGRPDPHPLATARAQVDAAHAAIARRLRDTAAAGDELVRSTRRAGRNAPDGVAPRERIAAARRALGADNAAALAARDRYLEVLGAWLGDEPAGDVGRLSAGYPIALLPVRIETRFGTQDGKPVLRLRVYPDEIAADTHEPELTAEEVVSAEGYWRAGWEPAAEAEAWRLLRRTYPAARAAWIVLATTPTNLAERPGSPPVFPVVPRKPSSWTRPAETRVLPDRWTVVCERGDRVLRASGGPIPDPLTLTFSPAIEPDDAGSVTDVSGDGLALDKAVSWTVDFAEAERVGMGLTIPLTTEDQRLGFDRVLVYGVKPSLAPEESATRLAALLAAHHYGRGLAFVPQGTPTNNSADGPASFPPPDPNGSVSYTVERGPSLAMDDGIGAALTTALGVERGTVEHVAGAERSEQRSAAAMNLALWPVSGGYFLEQLLAPLVPAGMIEGARQHFIRWVRGRGPLPAFRVGSTPYGCLPVTSLSRWQPGKESTAVSHALPALLRQLLPHWLAEREAVPRAGRGDPDQALIDILSMDASAREVWIRSLQGGETVENLAGLMNIPWPERRARQTEMVTALQGLWSNDGRVPRILSAVFQAESGRYRYPLVAAVLSERDRLDFNYLAWLDTASIEQLRSQAFPEGTPVPTALLYRLLRHAVLREYHKAALDLLIRLGQATVAERREMELVGIVPGTENRKTAWDYLARPVPGLTTSELSLGDHLRHSVQDLRAPAARRLALPVAERRPIIAPTVETRALAQVHDAIERLAGLPSAELDRLFTETMDSCAHRLDAWITSLATERLAYLRSQHAQGVHLGAFAWVENLRPVPQQRRAALPGRNGGFIHAPSMPHAATAAVLRNAYLTRSGEGRERYALDLSSRRVRQARWLLGAMREGQSLRALLGYQFERGLHQRGLEMYIEPLRLLFPLPERDELPVTGPTQGLSPRDVVDGLRLRAEAATIPYDTHPDLPPAGAKRDGVKAEIAELEATFDAVSDLLTADAVFHLVRGTTMGASASLDAQAQGVRPPDPEVVQVPRGGIPLTHRFAIVLGGDPVPDAWSGVPPSPRSSAEPSLDAWLASLLGDPDRIRCRVRFTDPLDATHMIEKVVTLAELSLRPTDLFDLTPGAAASGSAGGADEGGSPLLEGSALDRRVVVAAVGWGAPPVRYEVLYGPDPAWATDGIRTVPQALELLRVARELTGKARPLRAGDLLPPEVDPATAQSDPRTAEAEGRAQLALELLRAVQAELVAEIVAVPVPAAGDPEPDLTGLRDAVLAALAYGIGEFLPLPMAERAAERRRLVEIARGAEAELGRRIAAAQASVDAVDRVAAIFGRGFVFLPRFTPGQADDLEQALADGPAMVPEPGVKREWLQQLARVRPVVATWRRLETYARALGAESGVPDLAQLPYEANARWVGLPFTPEQAPRARRVSLALLRASAPAADAPWVGLMVDEWNEVIPSREETTGIGFHYDDPGAEAAQTILLAVPPTSAAQWDAEALEAILRETFDLAQVRAVHSSLPEGPRRDRQPHLAQLIPAIYLAANRRDDTISTDLHGSLLQQAALQFGSD